MENTIKKNPVFLITGATGLIGKTLVYRLAKEGARVYVAVRKPKVGKKLFFDYKNVQCVLWEDCSERLEIDVHVDYVVHAAAMTASKAFVKMPVDVIRVNLLGTLNALEFAREKRVKGFVYLSSMEVYGAPSTDEKITESYLANCDQMQIRSSYLESKRMCENLCVSYYTQFNVPAKVLRLTQTFGPGVAYNDSRVFAEFARCVIEERDIVLRTKGETKRSYLYSEDAVDSILTVLEKGVPGEAYNVANEASYCSILEFAKMVASKFGGGKIQVRIEEENPEQFGYASTLKMNLDTKKIQAIGWKARTDLEQMFGALVSDMRQYGERK